MYKHLHINIPQNKPHIQLNRGVQPYRQLLHPQLVLHTYIHTRVAYTHGTDRQTSRRQTDIMQTDRHHADRQTWRRQTAVHTNAETHLNSKFTSPAQPRRRSHPSVSARHSCIHEYTRIHTYKHTSKYELHAKLRRRDSSPFKNVRTTFIDSRVLTHTHAHLKINCMASSAAAAAHPSLMAGFKSRIKIMW
jgi:hypothetical protein